MTDSQLLQQYLHGSPDAMAELVRRHAGMVRATALRGIRNDALADDITQAVFIVLMRRAKSLSPRVVLGGWFFKTTLLAIREVRRKEARRKRHEQEAAQMHKHRESTSTEPPREEILEKLDDALARLPPADRDALVVRFLEGGSPADVAAAIGVNENTARQRVARALQKLRHILTGSGLAVTPMGLSGVLESLTPPTISHAVAAELARVAQGALPADHINLLAKGVLQIMKNSHIAIATAVAAGIVVAILLLMTAANQNKDPQPPVLAQSNPAPTVIPAAPSPPPTTSVVIATPPETVARVQVENTPRGVVVAAFQAAQTGDSTTFFGLMADADDTQSAALQKVIRWMAAAHAVDNAMQAKFGTGVTGPLADFLRQGVDPADIAAASETIEGDRATVGIGASGPGTIPMIRVNGRWKISVSTMSMMNPNAVERMNSLVPDLQMLVAEIKADKYKTADEVAKILQTLMQRVMPQRP